MAEPLTGHSSLKSFLRNCTVCSWNLGTALNLCGNVSLNIDSGPEEKAVFSPNKPGILAISSLMEKHTGGHFSLL